MKYILIVCSLFILTACDDSYPEKLVGDPKTDKLTNGFHMQGCEKAGLYTDAYFEKHGKDQILRFKCGGKKP